MSVAQVVYAHVTGWTGDPPPEAQAIIERIKAGDGFEGAYGVRNGGRSMSIHVYRDRAALEAALKRAMSPEAQALRARLGIEVVPGEVYENFTQY
jgi:hypothetical protein